MLCIIYLEPNPNERDQPQHNVQNEPNISDVTVHSVERSTEEFADESNISDVSMNSSGQSQNECAIPVEDVTTTIRSSDFQVENPSSSSSNHSETIVCSELDLGNWIGKSSIMSRDQKLDILKRCWVPPQTYDFKKECAGSSRSFIHKYLDTYAP